MPTESATRGATPSSSPDDHLSDPDLHTFIGGAPANPQAMRARYERLVAGSPDPTVSWCNWVVQLYDPPCLAGTVQATITSSDNQRIAEIAWVVGTPWQGRGIATEATRGLIAWLRQQHVQTVIAHIHPDHHASHAVATAAGLGGDVAVGLDESTGSCPESQVRGVSR